MAGTIFKIFQNFLNFTWKRSSENTFMAKDEAFEKLQISELWNPESETRSNDDVSSFWGQETAAASKDWI